jgi:hypothetical protein
MFAHKDAFQWFIDMHRFEMASRIRISAGKSPKPRYALRDSQSVKMTEAARGRGIDDGK